MMIETLNRISEAWCEAILLATIQNALFLSMLLVGLFILRKKDVRTLRLLALLGMLKLFLPPMNLLPESAVPATLNLTSVVGTREIVVWGAEPLAAKSGGVSVQTVFFLSWLLGSVTLFSVAVWKTVRLKKRFKHAESIETNSLAEVPKGVRVVQSESVHSPFLYGVFRPTIVLPKSFYEWPTSMKVAVLAHEIAHLRQYDHYLAVLQTLAKAMHFFNPIVFLFFKRLDELREMRCDDEAAKAANLSATDYANALLAVAEREESREVAGAIAFSEQFNSLKQRITYQLSKKEDFKMKNLALSLSAIAMIALSLNCAEEKKPDATLNAPTENKSADPPDFVNVEKDPEFINRATATYPEIVKQHGVEARVIVKALIGEDGLPKKVMVVKYQAKDTTIGEIRQAFENAATEATSASTFSPAQANGKAVATWLIIPYSFKLMTDQKPQLIRLERLEGTKYAAIYTVPRQMRVQISLYNQKMEFLKMLCDETSYPHYKEDGKTHLHPRDASFDAQALPKGKYWIQFKAEDYVEEKSFVIE